mmetsp:Transcript_24457/g.43352  ORF Transcript_24457/g.43352 Transcript_24457/m.43352 type:complete len:119 (-) Transcript_24457:34-390(-)
MFQTQKWSAQCHFAYIQPHKPIKRHSLSVKRKEELRVEREYTEAVLRERTKLKSLKDELELLAQAKSRHKTEAPPEPSYIEFRSGWRDTQASEAWQSRHWLAQSFEHARAIAAKLREA